MRLVIHSHELPDSVVEGAADAGVDPMEAFEDQLQTLSEQFEDVNDGAYGGAIAYAVADVYQRSHAEFTDSGMSDEGRYDLREQTK
ncbi:hypothetical protein [Haloplanus halobius]|uniref:hypothetical protein n=1 Tax=Haloplanus halobius TaxID=2934938 RepID=UPI00200C345E|nr:hypothetical protein [Haloplanus sp. XH21]